MLKSAPLATLAGALMLKCVAASATAIALLSVALLKLLNSNSGTATVTVTTSAGLGLVKVWLPNTKKVLLGPGTMPPLTLDPKDEVPSPQLMSSKKALLLESKSWN